MELDSTEDATIRQYLLGGLTVDVRESIEERLLTDAAFLERLEVAEDDLIDDFLRGGLSADDHTRFRQHFLCTTERRERIRFAEIFREYVATATTVELPQEAAMSAIGGRRQTVLTWALAASLLLAAAVAVWSYVRVSRLQGELDRLRASQSATGIDGELRLQIEEVRTQSERLREELLREQQSRAGLEAEVERLKARATPDQRRTRQVPDVLASLTLLPGLARGGGGTPSVTLRPDSGRIRLRLELTSNEYETYRAEIRTDDGMVWSRQDLRPGANGERIDVSVPARLLRHGDYELELTGRVPDGTFETVGRYYFRTVRR